MCVRVHWYTAPTVMERVQGPGCGLFFKQDKFELLAQQEIEYNDLVWGHPVGFVGATTGGTGARAGTRAGTLTYEARTAAMEALPPDAATYVRDCVGVLALLRTKMTGGDGGRGLHSSTSQLNLNPFRH